MSDTYAATRAELIRRANRCGCAGDDCPCWHDAEQLVDDIAAAMRERLEVEAGRDEWKRTHVHDYGPWPIHDDDGHLTEVQCRCACGDRYLAEAPTDE